jgi:hypothetical protein
LVRYIAENEEQLNTLLEPPPGAYLVLLVNDRPSHAFPLRSEVRLGRDKDNAIVVADQKVSRHHATLSPIDNTFIITDQGSANGTYLNGVQIAQPTRLKHQDRLTLGDTTFVFTIGQPELTFPEPAPPVPPAPVPVPRPSASMPALPLSPSSQPNTMLWVVFGCMALLVLFLLLALTLLLGLILGSSNLLGLSAWPGAWG